jgi:probable HAF family extracellular repeat protein
VADVQHAFIWHNGVIRDIGSLGGPFSRAQVVNDRGQVAGYGITATGEEHAFFWDGGVIIDLGTLLSYATAGLLVNGDANQMPADLDPRLGRRLAALPCDLVWATTWMAEANEVLAPRLGLPQLPVVDWPDDDNRDSRLHWKTRRLVQWAAGRPFVWADDEITDADRAWVAANHSRPALLYRADPHHGLSDSDLDTIARWLNSVQ